MKVQTVLFLSSTLATLSSAIPDVVPKLSSDPFYKCRSWPQNPYMLVVDSAEDDAINKLPVQPRNELSGDQVVELLAVDLRASKSFSKTLYACLNGGPTTLYEGKSLRIAQDKNNAYTLVNAPVEGSYLPELYTHSIAGVQQSGLYLGVNNQTTWGFTYRDTGCSADAKVSKWDYYEVKLLGLPESEHDSAGSDYSFKGFLKLDTRYS